MKVLSGRDKFIMFYNGDIVAAAQAAGISRGTAQIYIADPQVRAEIRARAMANDDPMIQNKIERQQWWTAIIRGEIPDVDMALRVKVSELLGRAHQDFVDKVETKLDVKGDFSWKANKEISERLDALYGDVDPLS